MSSMDDLVARARAEFGAQLRARLRGHLVARPREWLVEQLLDHVMTRAGFPPAPAFAVAPHRVRAVELTESVLVDFLAGHRGLDRGRLEAEGYLLDPPAKGGPLIRPEQRTPDGEELLGKAKDLLYWLLFGQEDDGVRLDRVERELLSLTVPRTKLPVFEFIRAAATEIGAEGTWADPEGSAHDDRAANTVVQVEYGDVAGELVGDGIVAALRLINDLEINEQVLYARMENVEQSTLI